MSNVEISEMLRYAKYPRETGLVIFINDRFNYQLREKHVLRHTLAMQTDGTTYLTVELDMSLPLDELGYRGTLRTIYTKIDAGSVFKNAFVIPDDIADEIVTKVYIRDKFKDSLKLSIEMDEFELITSDGVTSVVFNEKSLFWKGKVTLRKLNSPLPVDRLNLTSITLNNTLEI